MRFILILFLGLFLLTAPAQAQWKEPPADQQRDKKSIEDDASSQTTQKILQESGGVQGDMARYGWASAGVYHPGGAVKAQTPPAHAKRKDGCPPGGAFYTKLAGTPEQIAATTRAKAERGDAEAEQTLGMMYEAGSGVAEDWGEAAEWLRKAAEQSKGGAFGSLGEIYSTGGCGVTQNYPEAFFWFGLADDFEKKFAEEHHMDNVNFMTYSREERDDAAAHLSAQQKADVVKRVSTWLKDHPTPAAKP